MFDLSICVENNCPIVGFTRMTVAEHLWFFAKMKNVGVPDKKLKQEVDKLVDTLDMPYFIKVHVFTLV